RPAGDLALLELGDDAAELVKELTFRRLLTLEVDEDELRPSALDLLCNEELIEEVAGEPVWVLADDVVHGAGNRYEPLDAGPFDDLAGDSVISQDNWVMGSELGGELSAGGFLLSERVPVLGLLVCADPEVDCCSSHVSASTLLLRGGIATHSTWTYTPGAPPGRAYAGECPG